MKYIFVFLLSSVAFAQQLQKVDFKSINASLSFNVNERQVMGKCEVSFDVKETIDTIKIDAKNMTFNSLKVNGKVVNYKTTSNHLCMFEGFKKGKNKVTFSYSAKPKQTLYFIGEATNLQIWTQGQGRYTSHWLPSFDDVNEKVVFNLEVNFDANYTVLANGKLVKFDSNNGKWQYQMQKPMSSYLVMLAIGTFAKQSQKSKSGIPLEFYLDKKDTDKFEPTFRYSKQLFDFLEKEIGVKYPWKIYRQVPVRDFLYAGMENTTSTIFAQDFVVDSIGFNDRNYINVNAHELAHQWFGDLITAQSGKHHWLQEGFATYYALLAEKEVFGNDYFYHQLYKTAVQLRNAAKTDTIPVMNEKASSLSFYQKGAWSLHVIRESIGEKLFQKAVKNYLKKYKFKNVETDNFLAEINKVSNFDTESFKKKWLEDANFDYQEAIKLLSKNKFIVDYLEIKRQKELTDSNFIQHIDKYRTILESDAYYPIKQEIVFQIRKLDYKSNKDLVDLALHSNDYRVRQSVVNYFSKVPLYLKSGYETLLEDSSYTTREIAFQNLWNSYPEERENYLLKAQNWIGNNDKSLRMLYLGYAQLSTTLSIDSKQLLYNELVDYTSVKYESSIRQNAFDLALEINPKDEKILRNLVNATTHFKWQFNKYAKDKIKELVKSEDIKNILKVALSEFSENEKLQLSKLL